MTQIQNTVKPCTKKESTSGTDTCNNNKDESQEYYVK